MSRNVFRTGVNVVIVGLLAILLYNVTESIRPGCIGVLYDRTRNENSPGWAEFGAVDPTPLTGFQFISPFNDVQEYCTGTQTVYLSQTKTEGAPQDDSFILPTKSGLPVKADVNFSYAVVPSMAPRLYVKFQGQDLKIIEQGFLRSNIKSVAMDAMGQYDTEEVFERRAEIAARVFKRAQEIFSPFGIDLQAYHFGELRIEDANVMRAITERQQARQATEKAKADLQRIEVENQQKVSIAKSEAEQRVAQEKAVADAKLYAAQQEASSIMAIAEAKATANEKLSASLTSQILQQQQIEAARAIGLETARNAKFFALPDGGTQFYNFNDLLQQFSK